MILKSSIVTIVRNTNLDLSFFLVFLPWFVYPGGVVLQVAPKSFLMSEMTSSETDKNWHIIWAWVKPGYHQNCMEWNGLDMIWHDQDLWVPGSQFSVIPADTCTQANTDFETLFCHPWLYGGGAWIQFEKFGTWHSDARAAGAARYRKSSVATGSLWGGLSQHHDVAVHVTWWSLGGRPWGLLPASGSWGSATRLACACGWCCCNLRWG